MSEQIDIAVDLGAVAAPLPEILSPRQLAETAPAPPPEIIEEALHQRCQMIPGGTRQQAEPQGGKVRRCDRAYLRSNPVPTPP